MNLEKTIAETREWFRSKLSEKDFLEMDFSYITQDLLDCYELYAQPKDPVKASFIAKLNLLPLSSNIAKDCSCQGDSASSQMKEVWTYYGHHIVINGGQAKFFNDNYDNGPDSPNNACWGTKMWKANISRLSPPISCPTNSQGHNTMVRGMNE